VQKAGEQAEAAHKEAIEWRDKWEQALQKSNQFEVKVGHWPVMHSIPSNVDRRADPLGC
jgi:hypothetical protein